MEEETHASKTTSLARIRDNQRRSRARRKEYLQELEAKYRSCEQVGVEASAEIQTAARRVVDENRRLRALLKVQGLSDAEIDQASATPAEDERESAAAASLEALLGTRKECRGDDDRGLSSSISPALGPDQMQSLAGTYPMLQPRLSPATATPTMQSVTARDPPTYHQDLAPAFPGEPAGQAAELGSEHTLQPYYLPDAEMNFDSGQTHWPSDDQSNWTTDFMFQDPQNTAPMTASCQSAVDIIRVMEPDHGTHLDVERELGCMNGQECYPPPTIDRVLQVIDRFSNNQRG